LRGAPKIWNHFRGAGVAGGAGWAGRGAAEAVCVFGAGGAVFGGVPWTWTGVPTCAISKNKAAFAAGKRMQPWDAG